MDLSTQFQMIITCILFGIIYMITFEFINRLLYRKKGKIIRLLVETISFVFVTLIFFICMLLIANAKLNIFIPLFLLLGVTLYICFLEKYFQEVIDKFICKIENKQKQLAFLFTNKFAIIKKRYERHKNKRHEKNKRSKASNRHKKIS